MTVEQAGVLAEALKNARMSKAQETPPAVAEPFTAASTSDSRYRTGCNRRGNEEETVNTYTVILLYPDYIASNYGEDYYFWKGEAESPTDAARKAQQFLASEHNSDDATSEPEDFYVVAVIEGRPPMFFPE